MCWQPYCWWFISAPFSVFFACALRWKTQTLPHRYALVVVFVCVSAHFVCFQPLLILHASSNEVLRQNLWTENLHWLFNVGVVLAAVGIKSNELPVQYLVKWFVLCIIIKECARQRPACWHDVVVILEIAKHLWRLYNLAQNFLFK